MDSTLTLNCVIVSKWVFRIIWQACYKLPKVRFLYNTFYRPNEKNNQNLVLCSNLPFYNIFTDGRSSFTFVANLKTYELIYL